MASAWDPRALTRLPSGHSRWEWGYTQQRAFEHCRRLVGTSKRVARRGIPLGADGKTASRVWLLTDSWKSALAGMVVEGDEWRTGDIIVSFSAELSTTQQNLLQNSHFTWVTGYRGLVHLLRQPNPSGRLARWLEKLTEFEFDVLHLPGAVRSSPEYTYLDEAGSLYYDRMGVARPLVTELDALAVWREATGSVHPRSGGPRRSRQGLNGQERDLGKGAEGRNSRLEGGTGTHGPPGTSDSIAVTGDGGVGDVTRGQADFASDHASHGLSCETFRRSEQSVCHPFRLLSSILPYKSDDGFPRRPPSPTITGTMDATSALVASPDNATVTSQTPNITIGGASSQAAIPAPPSVASTVTQGAFTNKATIHTKSNNHSAASDPLPPITHPSTGIGSTAESDSHRVLPRRCENNGKPLASLEHESGTMVRAYLAQRIDEHVVWVRQLMDAYSESAAHKIMDELEGKQRVLTAGKHLLREIEEMEALQGRLANARRASATQVADLRKTGKGKKNNGHQ